jgi:DNA polymerase-1
MAMTMPPCEDWRALPFREIWAVDTEFYPGPGKANGGRDGDAPTPLCLVAHEMRSGRTVRLWQDEFGPFPPYRLDAEALILGYMISAEFGTHIGRGWGEPARALDPYLEFRHYLNDGSAKAEDREKGFFSINGALRYFCEDEIDTTHKKDMRDRIIAGPPFNAAERVEILDYCEDDVRALVRLMPHIASTLRSLPHALFRAKFQWAIAHQEYRGVPIDRPLLVKINERWEAMRTDLAVELDKPFGIYEIENGIAHWRKDRFKAYVRRRRMSWPTYENGTLDETDQTFREMEGKYPFIGPLRELRYSLSKLRLNSLQVGGDGRNRALLGAYSTKTGRNAPSTAKFVYGPAKWIRFLIAPPPGFALIHRDFCQQEVRIAALLSGDTALLTACECGDVYLGIAKQLGFAPADAVKETYPQVRGLFKTVVLGIQYGLGMRSLAIRTGLSFSEAGEILARLRAQFRTFEDYCASVLDHAGLFQEVGTQLGWVMQCPPGINPRTVRNFPMQSSGAEVMHVFCVLAERRGLRVVAPIHDGFLVECAAHEIDEMSLAVDRAMRDAAALVLRGYELPTEEQRVLPGERYYDERGAAMWETVTKLLSKLEERRA